MLLNLVEKERHDIHPAIDPRGKLSGVVEGKVILPHPCRQRNRRGNKKSSFNVEPGNRTSFSYAGAKGIVLAARTEKNVDKVAEDVKKISRKTQVLKVVTDVTGKPMLRIYSRKCSIGPTRLTYR